MKNYPTNKLKILNDPIYGFIRIPNSLIFDIIEHPSFQRLRRVSQMGFSNLVYPGANHTRFHHALGCLHLMQKTVNVLRVKGIDISEDEENALYIAILLHDIGHGAFSHALEHSIVTGITHEEISLKYMHQLNRQFDGQLDLAISVFNGEYHRKFLHQLITSQLDIDRLDYLKRDSFYTGVAEGNISSDRLIAMINVVDNELVIEKKGIYSVEKFLIARRLMYWQVYLHKTSLVAEILLVKTFERFQFLVDHKKEVLEDNHILYPFLNSNLHGELSIDLLNHYLTLDDADVLQLLKSWRQNSDEVLRTLSDQLINRRLPKIKIQEKVFSKDEIEKKKKHLDSLFFEKNAENDFVFSGTISNQTYTSDESQIIILDRNGNVFPISERIQYLDFKQFSTPVVKHYLCYPKPYSSV